MLKLGTKDIKLLYVGGKKIKKAFLGEKLVYTAGTKPSRLPDGYTEVKYIQSSGTQYINTGVSPFTTGLKIDMDVEPTANATSTDVYFFNSYYKSTYYYYEFSAIWSSSGIRGALGMFGSSGVTYTQLSSNVTPRRMLIQADRGNKTMSVDGDSKTLSSNNSFTNSMPKISLLAFNTGSNVLPAKLYSCQIYAGDSLERDFVPCTNPSGIAGLYDLANGVFYPSASTGPFAAGPVV